jgi:hypothetical protein
METMVSTLVPIIRILFTPALLALTLAHLIPTLVITSAVREIVEIPV